MANFANAARQPKTPVTGETIQQKLQAAIAASEWYGNLDASAKANIDNGLRRIAYQQAGSAYASYAGKGQQEARIERMDYETLARNYVQKKIDAGAENTPENNALWFTEFLARMMTVPPHTRNQTPHPNNFYTAEAMKAENELVDLLQSEARTLLDKGLDSNILQPALEKWAQAYITPPQKPLDINGEMVMSNQQSYQLYRSVPEHALAIKRVAEKVFGLNDDTQLTINIIDNDTGKITKEEDNTHSLREWIVRVGSQSIRNETWSPGDVDSKPHMRPEQMQRGILMGRVAIRQQYIHDLAKIGAQLESGSEGYQKIQANIWRFFNDIEELYHDHKDDDKGANVIAKIVAKAPYDQTREFLSSIQEIHAQHKDVRYENRLAYKRYLSVNARLEQDDPRLKTEKKAFFATSARDKSQIEAGFLQHIKNIGSSFIKADPYDKGYAGDVEKLHREMDLLAKNEDIRNITYKDIANSQETDSTISAIDALRMQAQTYGLQSQRITHRQSSEAYATGAEGIHQAILQGLREKNPTKPQLKLNGAFIEGYEEKVDEMNAKLAELAKEKAKEKAAQNEELIKELHKKIEDIRVPLTKDLITFLTDDKNEEMTNQIRKVIQDYTIDEMKTIRGLQDLADKQQYTLTPEDNRKIFTFESLEMVRIGMYSGGAVARELIAETNSAEALWNVFLMQELMIDPKQPPSHRPKKVPLVEYVDDIRNLDTVVDEAYAFEPFRKAEEKLTDRKGEHRYLKVWDEKKNALRDMNVEDMLGEIRASERFGDYMVVQVLRDIADSIKENKTDLSSQDTEHLDTLVAYLNTNAKQLSPYSENALHSGSDDRKQYYKTAVELSKSNPHVWDALQALVNYAEVMTAGSDATKSGSTALYTDITDAVMDAKLKLAKYGLYTEQKSGNGSALFRANINNAIMRMRQGLEMVQGPDMLAPETERVRTYRLKRKMDVEAGISEKNRKHAALVNLNNTAGIKDNTTDEEYLAIRAANKDRIAAYQELYKDVDFSAFVDECTPRKLQDVFKFAARPAGRLKEKSFDVSTMRAIGYGQALGATFGQPHLIHGLAEHVLGTDENGNFADKKAEEMALLYLKSPDLQDEINRAVFDLALYDSAQGWKNVEIGMNGKDGTMQIERTTQKGEPAITIDDKTILLSELQDKTQATTFVRQLLVTDAERPRIAAILRAAAIQDLEMTKALRGVNALMVKVEEEITKQKVQPLAHDALQEPKTLIERLQKLSPELGNELAAVRDAEIQARKEMTDIFRQVTTGEKPMPQHPDNMDKDDSKWQENKTWYDQASLPFARHMDIQENALGAHLEPAHAVHIAIHGKSQERIAA